jgi:hypothetical protein
MATLTSRDAHIDAALTNLSIAYRQEMPAFADRIFPIVPVDKQSDKYFVWNKGDMWRRHITKKRAPGTHFERAGVRLSNDQYYCEEYPLEYPIDDRTRKNSDPAVNLERFGTQWLVDQMNLEKDYQWATTYMTASPWTAGTALANGKWNTANSTPVTDVTGWARQAKRALGGSRMHKIVGVCGSIVESRLIANDQVRNAKIYVAEGTVEAIRASLAAVLGLDELIIFDREHNTAKENQTASYSPLVDDDFLVLAVPRGPGIEVPSAGYTFEWNDGNGTMYVESYRDEPIASDVLRGVCHFHQKQTGSDLGIFLADVVD